MLQPSGLTTLGSWWQGFGWSRQANREDSGDNDRRTYRTVVLEALSRADELEQAWRGQLEEERRHERLANAAAIYQWRLHHLRARVLETEVPVARRGWHRVLVASLDATVEATRLIGSGYRFANVRRVCDGELLLAEAREQLDAVRGVLGDG